jgi:hypothetical protein
MQATADSGKQQDYYHQQQTLSCTPQLTTSLSSSVMNDLCSRNLVPNDVGLCDLEHMQLTRHSIDAIIGAKVRVGTTTYNDVKRDFGRYETACSKVNSFGNYFTCDYDLSGNSLIVTVSYEASSKIAKTISSRLINC